MITNSDHIRAASELVAWTGAKIAAPAAERGRFSIAVERWLSEGDEVVPGLVVVELHGSKTPGELALVLEQTTLITGDLVRAHRADSLHLLPPDKISDRAAARSSIERLLEFRRIGAVLVGDGWPLFRDGHARLAQILG